MGHEPIGVVEQVGEQVTTLSPGDAVIVPFAWSDGTCAFCRDGITTSCVHGGFFDGAPSATQAEKLRVPTPTAPPSSTRRGPTKR
jgi:threonine dehydrogenase-like Zn-dependent dehydrogenase